jgi:hypothetical protein
LITSRPLKIPALLVQRGSLIFAERPASPNRRKVSFIGIRFVVRIERASVAHDGPGLRYTACGPHFFFLRLPCLPIAGALAPARPLRGLLVARGHHHSLLCDDPAIRTADLADFKRTRVERSQSTPFQSHNQTMNDIPAALVIARAQDGCRRRYGVHETDAQPDLSGIAQGGAVRRLKPSVNNSAMDLAGNSGSSSSSSAAAALFAPGRLSRLFLANMPRSLSCGN